LLRGCLRGVASRRAAHHAHLKASARLRCIAWHWLCSEVLLHLLCCGLVGLAQTLDQHKVGAQQHLKGHSTAEHSTARRGTARHSTQAGRHGELAVLQVWRWVDLWLGMPTTHPVGCPPYCQDPEAHYSPRTEQQRSSTVPRRHYALQPGGFRQHLPLKTYTAQHSTAHQKS